MRTRTSLAIVGAVLTASALTACTENGTPVASQTGSPNTSATTTPDNAETAPRVKDPISAADSIGKPCTLLTPTQATGLGLKAEGSQDSNGSDPYCSWHDKDNRALYTIGFLSENTNGLNDHYRAESKGDWKYFEPTTVATYPAVLADGVDSREKGYCTVVVGVRDELTFRVASRGGPGRAACDKVKDIAGEVINTLKAGA